MKGKEEIEEMIFNAEVEAEQIVLAAKKKAEEIIENARREGEDNAKQLLVDAQAEIDEQWRKVHGRQEVLEKWREEIAELERKVSFDKTRSETHRKECLRLKNEAKQIHADMLSQGTAYLNDLLERVGELLSKSYIEDDDILYSVSHQLNKAKKQHKQRMKDEWWQFASANLHDMPYDSIKVCMLAVNHCDLLADRLIGDIRRTGVSKSMEMLTQAIKATEAMFPPSVKFKISDKYIAAKKEQIELAAQIEAYKEQQKEERRRNLEAEREERQAQRELEAERKRAEKDAAAAEAAIARHQMELAQAKTDKQIAQLNSQIALLQESLRQANERRERAISMAQQTRCGYVYVISNVGSFGDGVYKIGLTRRVEPMERVVELGDASVPFPFDVHTFIYSEDAPALEAALHKKFDDRKVNGVNFRKEYFRVSLAEIRKAVEDLGYTDCQWIEEPMAAQWRDSQAKNNS